MNPMGLLVEYLSNDELAIGITLEWLEPAGENRLRVLPGR